VHVKLLATAVFLATGLGVLALPPCAASPQRPSTGVGQHGVTADNAHGTADLLVTLHDAQNAVFLQPAKVTLRSVSGEVRGNSVAERGRTTFRAVPLDDYEVSVEIQGLPTAKAEVSLQLSGESRTLDIVVGTGSSAAVSGPSTPPPLSMKEQKELTEGLRALQAGRVEEARKHFLVAAKTAPNHPDVDYLLGVTAAMTGDMVAAKQYFENAVKRYQYVRAYTALGELALQEGNFPAAKDNLEKALKAEPNTWRAEQLLAAVDLQQRAYPEAIQHAEHALQTGKSEAKGARLTLAQALAASGNYERSNQVLEELLKSSPTQEQTKEAEELLASNHRQGAPQAASDTAGSVTPLSTGSNLVQVGTLPLAPSLPTRSDNPLTEHPRWIPPNVDDSVPPADRSVACPAAQVVQQASKRVLEMVDSLDKFTATERLHHESLNEFGLATRNEDLTFEYMVIIREVKSGIFDVSEYRDGSDSREIFPEHVATLGTVALAFVFHPNYVEDFDFQCEGMAHIGEQAVWQIHFQQKANRQSRLRSYRLGTKYYRVGIKGRAWIATETSQILRMESDLVNQVPDLRLYAEHQDISYGPVPFKKRDVVLWLPYSSETYLDFNSHRIHRRQNFSNYMLFWVDDRERVEKPKETVEEQQPSPTR
jgi:tetratricopeptide (TPR) repeat protein